MAKRSNIADDLERSARTSGDKAALIAAGSTHTYAELDRQASSIAAGLHSIGVRKGDRIAFAVGNTPEFVGLHYGTLRAGAASVPLNPGFKAAELRPFLSRIAPRVIVGSEGAVNEIMSAGPHPAPVFVIGQHATARPFSDLEGLPGTAVVETGSDDLAVLAYTSGTAGSPKAAQLTHGNLDANLQQLLGVPGDKTEPSDRVLGVLPLYHVFALNVILGLSIRQGATVVLEETFDPVSTMRRIVEHEVTIIVGVPPMFKAWLALPNSSSFDLSKVRFAASGASPLAPEVIERFRSAFGVEIWDGYGLSETSPVVSTTRMGEQRPGSIGKPLPGVEVKVVDSEGNEALPGDPGELWVRGPNVFSGYWKSEEASELVFSGDWFKTGDIGYRDEQGYLWLVDRRKEVIDVSGFNVYPKEVEEALVAHPFVRDAAVVGEPDPHQGEMVKAYVVLEEGELVGEDQLIVHCATRLARFKVPKEIEVVPELPRTAAGKLIRRKLGSVE